jgi:hypothetical protein
MLSVSVMMVAIMFPFSSVALADAFNLPCPNFFSNVGLPSFSVGVSLVGRSVLFGFPILSFHLAYLQHFYGRTQRLNG